MEWAPPFTRADSLRGRRPAACGSGSWGNAHHHLLLLLHKKPPHSQTISRRTDNPARRERLFSHASHRSRLEGYFRWGKEMAAQDVIGQSIRNDRASEWCAERYYQTNGGGRKQVFANTDHQNRKNPASALRIDSENRSPGLASVSSLTASGAGASGPSWCWRLRWPTHWYPPGPKSEHG
jgi:hypothetical protein